jgi:hypothetical protein
LPLTDAPRHRQVVVMTLAAGFVVCLVIVIRGLVFAR